MLEKLNVNKDPLFGEKLQFTLASFMYPQIVINSFEFDKDEIKKNCLKYHQLVNYLRASGYLHNVLDKKQAIADQLTDDFYGVLQGQSMEVKKKQTLEIYRIYFRLCTEKLQKFVNDLCFVAMVIQYIECTGMKRIHAREGYLKNLRNYYVAVENMISYSDHRRSMIDYVVKVQRMYEINILARNKISKDEEGADEDY